MPADTRSKKMDNLTSNKKLDFIITQINNISGNDTEINKKIDSLTNSTVKLEKDVIKNKDQIDINAEKLDELEQYSRRNNLKLHGIPEEQQENSDNIVVEFINKNLGIPISLNDIDRSHRVGQRRRDQSRAILVKSISYRKRAEMFQAKKNLKGSGWFIIEDLTKKRYSILLNKRQQFGIKNTWTRDGKILGTENGNSFSYPKVQKQ